MVFSLARSTRRGTGTRVHLMDGAVDPLAGEDVTSQNRQALLIVNRRSRQGTKDPAAVAKWLRSRDIDVALRVLDNPALIPRVVAAHAEFDTVIIAGGDGSLGSAAPVLMRSGQRLGILPAGTANNLALTLGIPADWMEAARVIADGRTHPVDLGCVNEVPFFTLASVGLSGELTHHLSDAAKGRFGLLAYAGATIKALRRTRSFRATIRHGESILRVRSIQIGIANGRFFGMRLQAAPDSAIDDGLLYLYSIEPTPLHRLVRLAVKMPTGKHVHDREVLLLKGETFELTTRPELPVDTDGELTTRTPARFRVLPGALSVYVPTSYSPPAPEETTDASEHHRGRTQ